jgi:hypothetical protein
MDGQDGQDKERDACPPLHLCSSAFHLWQFLLGRHQPRDSNGNRMNRWLPNLILSILYIHVQ